MSRARTGKYLTRREALIVDYLRKAPMPVSAKEIASIMHPFVQSTGGVREAICNIRKRFGRDVIQTEWHTENWHSPTPRAFYSLKRRNQ